MKQIEITEADKDRALKMAVVNLAARYEASDPKRGNRCLWSHVGNLFGLGSGYATALCLWAGVDPDLPCNKMPRR